MCYSKQKKTGMMRSQIDEDIVDWVYEHDLSLIHIYMDAMPTKK